MTPRQVIATLRAHWVLAVLVVLLTVSAVAAVSMTMLKRYTATASVMLDARSHEQVAGGANSSSLPGGYIATQMELIYSERVGRAVIKALKLNEDAAMRAAWSEQSKGAGDFEAWLSSLIVQGLNVRPAAVSNVLTISYTSRDASEATRFANAFVNAYMDVSLDIRMERVRQSGTFFDARAKELRTDLERAQARLSDFQQKNGLLVGDERLNVEATRLTELSAQLLAVQTASAEVSARLRQAGRQTDQLQEVWRNPAVASLTADIAREEVRMRELTARLGERHPQLIEQEARLGELRNRLAAEQSRAASNVGFDNTAGQARVGQLAAAVEAQRAKVMRLQGQREQGVALLREVDSAQRAYDAVLARLNLSSLESQNTQTNVTVLKQATQPMSPSSPNLQKNLVAGLGGGVLLALALVLGREHLDRRLRTVDDVAQLKQSLLVSLPVAAHKQPALTDTSRTRQMKQRVLTGLPRPAQSST